jgi:hypothetical protein
MENRNENKLKMLLATKILLLSSPTILAKIPNSTKFMADLDAAILQIDESENELDLISTGGNTINKAQLREVLESTISESSRKIQAFALFTGNTVLQAETKITRQMITAASEIKLLNIANGIYGRIEDHVMELREYDLGPETQMTFRTQIDSFANAIPAQSQSELNKKELKRLVDEGFAKADATLVMLDAGVEIVHTSEPAFYASYKKVRKTRELGKGSLQVQGTVTDAATAKPIAGATITFYAQGQTTALLVKKTAAAGGFNVKSLPEGMYDVTVEKTGCKSYSATITVVFEDLCRVDVKLDKL